MRWYGSLGALLDARADGPCSKLLCHRPLPHEVALQRRLHAVRVRRPTRDERGVCLAQEGHPPQLVLVWRCSLLRKPSHKGVIRRRAHVTFAKRRAEARALAPRECRSVIDSLLPIEHRGRRRRVPRPAAGAAKLRDNTASERCKILPLQSGRCNPPRPLPCSLPGVPGGAPGRCT